MAGRIDETEPQDFIVKLLDRILSETGQQMVVSIRNNLCGLSML